MNPLQVILGILRSPYELSEVDEEIVRHNLELFRVQETAKIPDPIPQITQEIPDGQLSRHRTRVRLDLLEHERKRLMNDLNITSANIKIARVRFHVLEYLRTDSQENLLRAINVIEEYLYQEP